MNNPLCCQTVTLYHSVDGRVERRVVNGCFYSWHVIQKEEPEGLRQETAFLLILPPGETVRVGDRVLDGVGPETVDWHRFLPVNTRGLSQVAYVKPCCLNGVHHHTEAGRK